MKKISLLLAIMMIATVALSGCGNSGKPTDGTNGGTGGDVGAGAKDTLVIAMNSAPSTLDGNGKNDSASLQVRTQIYEGLIRQNEKMEIEPLLAEKWDLVDDTTIVFSLRKGVKFHNGDEMKASDVAFSIKRAYDMGFAESTLSPIDFDKCEVVDDYTYKVVLKHPFSPILANMADSCAVVVPERVVKEQGEEYLSSNPIGTGPYKLANWVQGDRIELVKNEDYWRETKGLQNIIMRFISEGTNRAIEVEVGGVDIAFDIQPTDIARLQDNKDVTVYATPNLSTTYIGFNCTKKPFDDKRVRQAVAHALDLSSIVDAVYAGAGSVGNSVISSSVWGASDEIKPLAYDPELAKSLLKEAGFENGLTTNIWTSDSQQRIDIAEIAQNSLKNVGINAEVKILEWGTFLKAVEDKELDIYILGKTASTGDGDALHDNFYSTSHFSGNTAYFQNPEIDKMLDESRTETDADKRFKLLVDIQKVVIEEAPWIPVWDGQVTNAARNNVQGFVNHPTNFHYLADVYLG